MFSPSMTREIRDQMQCALSVKMTYHFLLPNSKLSRQALWPDLLHAHVVNMYWAFDKVTIDYYKVHIKLTTPSPKENNKSRYSFPEYLENLHPQNQPALEYTIITKVLRSTLQVKKDPLCSSPMISSCFFHVVTDFSYCVISNYRTPWQTYWLPTLTHIVFETYPPSLLHSLEIVLNTTYN